MTAPTATDGDDDRRADAHPPDERDAGGEQAGDRDDDDRAGRDDARARGRVGDARAVLDGVAGRQLLAVAADDQQRVVDPGAEAEHHAERRGEAGEVGERGAEAQQQDAAGERDQAGEQRQQHRGGASEHQREHDDRHGEADQLAHGRAHLLGLVDDRASSRHLEAGALADLGHVRQAFARRPLEVLRGLVVLHGQEADPLIAGELQRGDAGDVRLAFDGLLGLLDRGVALEVLAREHERRGVAGLRREPLGQEVERLLGLRAWSAEGVDEGAAAGRGRRTEGDEHHGDDGEGAFPMPRGRGGETSEYMGHAFQGITLRAKLQ